MTTSPKKNLARLERAIDKAGGDVALGMLAFSAMSQTQLARELGISRGGLQDTLRPRDGRRNEPNRRLIEAYFRLPAESLDALLDAPATDAVVGPA